MKSLIVDDEMVSRNKLARILEPYGQCVAAHNGRRALAAFKEAWEAVDPFDLICLDIDMPDMDGTEVLFQIRQWEEELGVSKEKPVKAVMVTGMNDRDAVITSIQAGCDSYLVKPFQRTQVLKKLAAIGLGMKKAKAS